MLSGTLDFKAGCRHRIQAAISIFSDPSLPPSAPVQRKQHLAGGTHINILFTVIIHMWRVYNDIFHKRENVWQPSYLRQISWSNGIIKPKNKNLKSKESMIKFLWKPGKVLIILI